jgi:predicted enzyme related to lactoylglutathione lyase
MVDFESPLTVAVSVTDWNASRAWYKEKLGLTEQFATEEGGWADFVGPGGASIGLSALNGEPHPGAGGTVITFGVKNIEAARAELESKGVEFLGPNQEFPGMVLLATFQDPDGNQMMLAQSLMQP